MTVGRPPKPTALKVLNGSAAHDPGRINRSEPQVTPLKSAPPPPADLVPEATAAWRRLAKQALSLGVLADTDLELLGLTAMAYAEFKSAQSWRERDAAWKRYLTGLREFGLSPSSRTRLHAAPKAELDPMAELIASRNRRAAR